jgi:hypothetical protein
VAIYSYSLQGAIGIPDSLLLVSTLCNSGFG